MRMVTPTAGAVVRVSVVPPILKFALDTSVSAPPDACVVTLYLPLCVKSTATV